MPTRTESTLIVSLQTGLADKLKELSVPHSVLSLIPYDIAIEYSALPFVVDGQGRGGEKGKAHRSRGTKGGKIEGTLRPGSVQASGQMH